MDSFLTAVHRIVSMVMRVASIGAFGVMAFIISAYGLSRLLSLGQVLVSVYLTCFVFIFAGFGLVARSRLMMEISKKDISILST